MSLGDHNEGMKGIEGPRGYPLGWLLHRCVEWFSAPVGVTHSNQGVCRIRGQRRCHGQSVRVAWIDWRARGASARTERKVRQSYNLRRPADTKRTPSGAQIASLSAGVTSTSRAGPHPERYGKVLNAWNISRYGTVKGLIYTIYGLARLGTCTVPVPYRTCTVRYGTVPSIEKALEA